MSTIEKIKDFIVSENWVRATERENLTAMTRLSEDLGIDGDDADEFLNLFSERFLVDFSGLEINRYFASEGFDPIRFIINIVKPKKYKSITLGDLEKAIVEGKWTEDNR